MTTPGVVDWGDGTTTELELFGFSDLLVFGDSLSALNISGDPEPGGRWPELLVASGAVDTERNFAYSGATSEWYQPDGPFGAFLGWQGTPPVAPGPVDLLVVYFGANDVNTAVPSIEADLIGVGLSAVSLAEFNANIDWFLANYPANQQVVVYPWRWVTGPVAGVPVDELTYIAFRDEAAQAASDAGAVFVDMGDLVPDATSFVRDWVHANADGHELVAASIIAAL